ncbi:hypothetical protein LuPra_06250 [Luteitalea pratensis]|uniref:Uncharacterized protein n=1 Tax=Luteitalea pratensis TaxID=1855912 RepID=A0A143PYR6_LUTPR|nr:hypothetical protein [Luteitalea pratensis]AMY12964.1 hypothetical protein LuPra_06250 [Luteitalea pratensis]
MSDTKVLVLPGLDHMPGNVWAALREILPISFEDAGTRCDITNIDAILVLRADDLQAEFALRTGKPCFIVGTPESHASTSTGEVEVRFEDAGVLDSRLRGQRLAHTPFEERRSLQPRSHDTVCACIGDAPVWLQRPDSAVTHDIVAYGPPHLKQGESLLDHCHGTRFLQVVPLVHFLRRVLGARGWSTPGLRACFMFDDPNLHWPTYGHISYSSLAKAGREERFHAAMAMVPLDCWFEHPRALELFRAHPDQLSLLFHGSHHLYAELASSTEQSANSALIADAFARISRFEARTGVAVNRSMAAPHGACSLPMMHVMLTLGMEGACISPWSLRLWNPDHDWGPAFGLSIAELTTDGFAVLPRFRLGSGALGDAVLAAFLDRPIVPVGHHNTLAEGIDLLTNLARDINVLGDVRWCSMREIQQSNYLSRRTGSTLVVRPGAARVRVCVPDGVDRLEVETPAHCATSNFQIEQATIKNGRLPKAGDTEAKNSVRAGERIWLSAVLLGSHGATPSGRRPLPARALARRLLCEARDRLQPLVKAAT